MKLLILTTWYWQLILLGILASGAVTVYAETVYMKDGSKIIGAIIHADAKTIELQTTHGTLKLPKDDIVSVDYTAESKQEPQHPASTERTLEKPPPAAAPSEPARKTQPVESRQIPEKAKRMGFFTAFDIFTIADAYKKDEENFNKTVADLKAIAGFTASGTFDISPGIGGRIGFLYPMEGDLDLGVSAGYVKGPSGEYVLNVSGFGDSGKNSGDGSTSFFRLLAEGVIKMPINEKTAFHLGGGIGFASGSRDSNFKLSGALADLAIYYGLPTSGSDEISWSGLTWEISPALVFKKEKIDFLLGIRYAAFPKLKETDDWNEFDWKPFAFFLGMAF